MKVYLMNQDYLVETEVLYENLSIKGKVVIQRIIKRRGKIVINNLITERPQIANDRGRIGDWEADTVLGQTGKACLVTLTDRKSRYLLCKKIAKKNSTEVKMLW